MGTSNVRKILDVTQPAGSQTVLRLRSNQRPFNGQEIDVLYPVESNLKAISSELNPSKAAPLKHWLLYHQAYLLEQSLGENSIMAIHPGRIKVEPYQLVPLMQALKMSRPRLLLCDDVGLGKTIQAGLIIVELMARRLAHRILVVSPAGPLQKQWQKELIERFGLRFDIIDREKLEEIRRGTELGSNPFDFVQFGLVSMDFLKQERVLEQAERAAYDIVVIDEAHHCSETQKDEEDYDNSQRRIMARVLASRCDALLLLTATPHNGYDRSFASLLELLDGSLTDSKGNISGNKYKDFVIRRIKSHIKDHKTGKPKFKKRMVRPVAVAAFKTGKYPDYEKFYMAFDAVVKPVIESAFRAKRFSDVLSFISLMKRTVSTVKASLATLKIVKQRYSEMIENEKEDKSRTRERIRSLRDLNRKMDKFGTISYEEEYDKFMLETEDIAEKMVAEEREVFKSEKRLSKNRKIESKLDELIALAEKAIPQDPKLDYLVKEVREIRKQEPESNILIFTEYIDSQEAVLKILSEENFGKIISISGNDDEETRLKNTEIFTKKDKVILVSTDASAEGLNLQKKCHHLIHLELPFNPNRLEQRNGRIDRYGQEKEPIISYLYLKNTIESNIFARLLKKYERQREKLMFVPDTFGISISTDYGSERLLSGYVKSVGGLFDDESDIDFNSPAEEPKDDKLSEIIESVTASQNIFEEVIMKNPWLGQDGMNADLKKIQEAFDAEQEGNKLMGVDLLSFLIRAIESDGIKIEQKNNIYIIKLPEAWAIGLEGMPGFIKERAEINLNNDIEVASDEEDNPISYLCRSHPLLLNALDKVKSISFGRERDLILDRRVTACIYGKEKGFLLTFIGNLNSKKGRVFEKVAAVFMSYDGVKSSLIVNPEDWQKIITNAKAIDTTGIWEKNFKLEWDKVLKLAEQKANEFFKEIFVHQVTDNKNMIDDELVRTDKWFSDRVFDITGPLNVGIQAELFSEHNKKGHDNSWINEKDPERRLFSFKIDSDVPRTLRSDAETLYTVYKKRKEEIEKSEIFGKSMVRLLGVAMILPDVVK